MQGAPAFEDVLDAALRRVGAEVGAPGPAAAAIGVPVAEFDWRFARPLTTTRPAIARAAVRSPVPETGSKELTASIPAALHSRSGLDRPFARVATAPSRPRRSLTPAEQHALQALNRLGAAIAPQFTAAELRTAFRQLARRYHPDRHAGADAARHRELARTFTDLHRHYQTLRLVAEPA